MIKSGGRLFARGIIRITPTITRQASTALHFYQNRQLELYASKEAKRLTLRQLVRKDCFSQTNPIFKIIDAVKNQVYFGRSMNEERLLKVRALATFNYESNQKDTSRVPTTFALNCPSESLIDYATSKLCHTLW